MIEKRPTQIYSVIDVECVNSVSNRSKDIISLIIKVCRRFLLNNKILTFHDLFTFTELIDKQQQLTTVQLITINYYMCVGEGDIVNCYYFCRFLIYSTCNFAIPWTSIAGMRERRPDSGKHLSSIMTRHIN